jgi:hypothetical protein
MQDGGESNSALYIAILIGVILYSIGIALTRLGMHREEWGSYCLSLSKR